MESKNIYPQMPIPYWYRSKTVISSLYYRNGFFFKRTISVTGLLFPSIHLPEQIESDFESDIDALERKGVLKREQLTAEGLPGTCHAPALSSFLLTW